MAELCATLSAHSCDGVLNVLRCVFGRSPMAPMDKECDSVSGMQWDDGMTRRGRFDAHGGEPEPDQAPA
jgi:hypothetical protein